ncbi:trypsin-like serine peptidase [Legionella brunensis]|uniref:Serine protease n=1 Tax=Legionella brunensis TaxID=29422 RepID=A0A0W0SE88_9GAMM|nr:trypsin-like serine protease [Legionella brunensis]KTC81465.1 Extracellular metalloprotease precursor [Legionella brunensis]
MSILIKGSILIFSLYSFQVLADNEIEQGVENKQSEKSLLEYWTPERLMNAKEMPYPKADPNQVQEIDKDSLEAPSEVEGFPQGEEGAPPENEIEPGSTPLIPQNMLDLKQETTSQFFFERGLSGANFTSSRLVPLTADLSYPYRTVGRLFFTIPGAGNYTCSASVLQQRVIVTAGHCVHSGNRSGYFTNFLFIPAYRDGKAPYQTWSWRYVVTTSTWATGGGNVPNAADYAMIEVNDKTISGTVRRLGSVTGYLGYRLVSLTPNHVHLLGYPCNLDSCSKMHQVMAQSFRSVAPNNVEYGSDMQGGSSGGPWVQNFGLTAVGQVGANNPYRNAIVGITSYGYVNERIMLQGSSVLDTRFANLRNIVCNHRAGNCS